MDSLKANNTGSEDVGGPLSEAEPLNLKTAREREVTLFGKKYLTSLLSETDWNIKETCRIVDISRPRIYELLRKHGLSR